MANTPKEAQVALNALREENEALAAKLNETFEALDKAAAYIDRLKRERDAARGETAAFKSRLADAHAPDSVGQAIAKALRGVRPQSANLLTRDRSGGTLPGSRDRVEKIRKSLSERS